MELLRNIVNRWAASDGPLTFAAKGSARVSCGEVAVSATVEGGRASVSLADAKALMPEIGAHSLTVEADGEERECVVERVSNRYTDKQSIVEYGRRNNDGFDDAGRYSDADFAAAILAAEEAIERGCMGRSFCRRRIEVTLTSPKINELPIVDARSIESEADVRLLSYCQASGVPGPTAATVEYGTALDATIARAATQLAASILRPRATPENARGTSQDGVYISYELPTGAEGGWTGLPSVDAAIESHRARRVVIG